MQTTFVHHNPQLPIQNHQVLKASDQKAEVWLHFCWLHEHHQETVVNHEKQRVLSSVISHLSADWPRLLIVPANAPISRLVPIRREGLYGGEVGDKATRLLNRESMYVSALSQVPSVHLGPRPPPQINYSTERLLPRPDIMQ